MKSVHPLRSAALQLLGCLALCGGIHHGVSTSNAEDWPQFRGPDGQGHASDRPVATTWSESENITWKTAIPGRGWSSPVILGSQIWMTTATDEGHSLRAICVDRATGSLLHDVEVFKIAEPVNLNAKNSHASPTSVIEPGRLYVHFGTMGTACLDTNSGTVLWTNQELKIDHKEGPGSSPVLWNEFLIVNCDGMDIQYVAALDKHTGKVAWWTWRSGPLDPKNDRQKAYCTPLVIRVGERDQLVSPGADWCIAYDPLTGGEIWKVHYRGYSTVPRPLFAHGLLYFITGFDKPELIVVRPDGQGDVTESHVVWRYNKQVPANPSPIIVGGEIYFVSDQGVCTCLDALTGEDLWRQRLAGKYSASPILAGGLVYFSNEDGTTFVLRPGRQYELLATNQLEGQLMASPVAVDGELFLRTDTHLYRIEPKAATAASAGN